MSDRIEEELEVLLEVYPSLETDALDEQRWVLLRSCGLPSGWHAASNSGEPCAVQRVDMCCKIPPQREVLPYGFAVRPGLVLPGGGLPDHYSYPFQTPWGGDFGHFSWQAETGWHPQDDVHAGDNMLTFVRSFHERLATIS